MTPHPDLDESQTPPLDQDERWPEAAQTINQRSSFQLGELNEHLKALVLSVVDLTNYLSEGDLDQVEILLDRLGALFIDRLAIQGLLVEMNGYIDHLLANRHSALTAYHDGWQDRLSEILGRLSPQDQATLLWLIRRADHPDGPDADQPSV